MTNPNDLRAAAPPRLRPDLRAVEGREAGAAGPARDPEQTRPLEQMPQAKDAPRLRDAPNPAPPLFWDAGPPAPPQLQDAAGAAKLPAQADAPQADAEADPAAAAARARRARRRALTNPPTVVPAAPKAPPAPAAAPAAPPAPEVRPARMQRRHYAVLASFALLVLLPLAASVAYLYTRAADQYHSAVAFSIRSEEPGMAAAGVLGALTQMGTGTASDSDILFEFIRSQRIVEEIDAGLDLRAIYNKAEGDPVFTLGDARPIEALHAHWQRMVEVSLDPATGIVSVLARAFTPEDAHAISQAILAQSSALVNRLSDQAQEDAIRFAREELAQAESDLRDLRQRLGAFRSENRMVDPAADVAGQMGLLNALEAQLAAALVDRDVLLSFVGESDQRVIQANRRIDAINGRIEDERSRLDSDNAAGSLPDVVGTFEALRVDLEFASTAYTQTLSAFAAARAEARRQSRYLAPHIQPTMAQSALYPQRALLSGLVALFLVLGWSVLMLVYYNVRDNR